MHNYPNQPKQAQLLKISPALSQSSKLPPKFQQALAQKRYILSVRLLLKGDCDDYRARRIAHAITGIIELECWDEEWNELTEFEPVDDEPKPIDIGYISGWRTLSSNPDEILDWADQISVDVCSAFSWLVVQQAEFSQGALFIDQVVIKPCWGSQQFTLKAIATYLDLVGCKFVFTQTTPSNASCIIPQQSNSMKHLPGRYWQKLGLQHHDPANNIAWTDHWQCSQWLQVEDDY